MSSGGAAALKRLKVEAAKLQEDDELDELGVSAEPSEEDVLVWDVTIIGPDDTPYEGAVFNVTLTFAEGDYPYKPPKVIFQTKVYHPNISSTTGEICQALLSDGWDPKKGVRDVLLTLLSILKNPDADNTPIEAEIGREMKEDKDAFEEKVRDWVRKYAC